MNSHGKLTCYMIRCFHDFGLWLGFINLFLGFLLCGGLDQLDKTQCDFAMLCRCSILSIVLATFQIFNGIYNVSQKNFLLKVQFSIKFTQEAKIICKTTDI